MAKTKDELQQEVAALRAQVRSLSTPSEENAATDDSDEAGETVDFEGLVDSLRQEIDELPAMTTLALFTLGIVVGRLLAH